MVCSTSQCLVGSFVVPCKNACACSVCCVLHLRVFLLTAAFPLVVPATRTCIIASTPAAHVHAISMSRWCSPAQNGGGYDAHERGRQGGAERHVRRGSGVRCCVRGRVYGHKDVVSLADHGRGVQSTSPCMHMLPRFPTPAYRTTPVHRAIRHLLHQQQSQHIKVTHDA